MKKWSLILAVVLSVNLFSDPKVVLVTGASKGIGRAICEELASHGEVVYGTMRHPDQFDGFEHSAIKIKELDVTRPEQIDHVVSEIISEQGRIDVVVNNAAQLLLGPCEELTVGQVKAQFDTNFFGPFTVIQAVLPQMRAQKQGHIINISSVMSYDPIAGFDAYVASKSALSGLSATMASYMGQFGIKVSIVEPGPVKTSFTKTLEKGERHLENNPYEAFTDNLVSLCYQRQPFGQSPEEVAQLVTRITQTEHPKLRYQTDLSSVQRAQKSLVDITGCQSIDAKQSMVKELFVPHIDE